jgi:hypothetical protein
MLLTEHILKQLTFYDRGRILRDGESVSGKVHVVLGNTVSVHFRFRFRFDGNTEELTPGTWPRKSLNAIRSAHAEARARVTAGINPVLQAKLMRKKVMLEAQAMQHQLAEPKRVDAAKLTLNDLFSQWFEDWLKRKDKTGTLSRLNK